MLKKLSSRVRPGVLEARASSRDPGQRIDERRLAHIGAAGKGDFNALHRRQLVKRRHAHA